MIKFRNKLNLFLIFTVLFLGCSKLGKMGGQKKDGQGAGTDSLGGIELPNIEVHKRILPNGLTVLVHENKRLPLLSYYTFYNVGGRYESREEGTTGATHFLEHMMFKGAQKYGPGKFDTLLEGLGGSTNAYTTFDSTVYHQELPSLGLELILDMEADRMGNLTLENEAFEKERAVIFEERKMRYENSPHGKLFLTMMQEVFKGTPYGGSVIGEESDLKSLNRDQMMKFFKKFYVPNNAIIIIVGDVDHDDVFDKVEKKFGHLKPNPDLELIKQQKTVDQSYKIDDKNFGGVIKTKGNNPVPLFYYAFKGEPLGTRKAFVMDLVSSVLGAGESSFMNQKYVKAAQPVLSSISVSNYNLLYGGVFYISGEMLNTASLEKFHKKFKVDMKKMCGEAVTDRALQKAKNQFMVGYFNELSSNDDLASFLGSRENFFGDYNYYQKEVQIYQSIGKDEVLKTCSDLLENSKNIYFTMTNK